MGAISFCCDKHEPLWYNIWVNEERRKERSGEGKGALLERTNQAPKPHRSTIEYYRYYQTTYRLLYNSYRNVV